MSGCRLLLLGGFRLYDPHHVPVQLTARKARALLAYLALRPGGGCSRDRLAALLWADSGDARARQSLRQALATLRRALPADSEPLETAGEEVRLVAEALTVDVHEFERLVDTGATEDLERAVALYQGDFLEGFNPRAPEFDDWLMAERTRLRERALVALEALLDHDQRAGETARATRRALRLLALDPLREPVHRALMELYARQGQYGAAVRQYRVCQATLRRELGIPPEDETDRVLRRIMQERRSGPASVEAVPPIDAGAADETIPVPGTPDAQPESRHATVLVARPGTAEADPETGGARVKRRNASAQEWIRGFGGWTVPQSAGALIGVFGIPRAHSNDAEHAVRAAVSICDALPEARVGVASGRAKASGEPEPIVTGAAVDRARDLAARCRPGEIRLSGALYAAVARRISAERVDDGLEAWRVDVTRAPDATKRPTFVGRERERRQVAAAMDTCCETGSGQSLLVRGPAGIGKSRLLEKCTELAESQGFASHTVEVLDFGAGQEPIRSLVHSLLGLAPGADTEHSGVAAEEAVAAGLIDPARRAELNDLLGLPQPSALQAEFEAVDATTRRERREAVVAGLLAACAHQQPLLVMVEDIHWAEPATLGHLARLASVVAECPALLVMTHRLEGEPLDPAWRGAMQGAPLTTIDLAPLRAEELRALATEVAAGDDARVRRCIERAGGNPWFLEQLLRTETNDGASVPDSVRSLVWARLDRLGAADKGAVRTAAVLGQRFPAAALRHLLEDPDYDATPLVDHHLLQPDAEYYRFSHDLIRQGVYEAMPASEQRRLHERAAAWFRNSDAVLVAQHLDRAGSPEAASAYLEGARVQAQAFAYERARELAARGLEVATGNGERYALLRLLGEILHEIGSIDAAIEAYRGAAAAAVDDEQRCNAWLGLAASYSVRDRHDDALAALDAAEPLAGYRGEALARLHSLRGNVLFPMGRIEDCLKAHRRARKYAREAGLPDLEARALSGLGDAAYLRGQMITAGGHFARCVELARAHGLVRIEASNLPMRALTRFYCNELDEARRAITQGAELAARIAHTRAETMARDALLTVLCYQADWPEAEWQAEQGLELARRLGARRFEADYLLFKGLILLGEGDRAAAEQSLDQAYALSREGSLAYVGAWILAALAAATDDPDKRRRALSEGETLLAAGSVSHNHLHFHQIAIDVALADADWHAARRHCAALAEYTRAEPLAWSDFFVARGHALADWGHGERDEAVRHRLQQLADEARNAGLATALPALERALEAA